MALSEEAVEMIADWRRQGKPRQPAEPTAADMILEWKRDAGILPPEPEPQAPQVMPPVTPAMGAGAREFDVLSEQTAARQMVQQAQQRSQQLGGMFKEIDKLPLELEDQKSYRQSLTLAAQGQSKFSPEAIVDLARRQAGVSTKTWGQVAKEAVKLPATWGALFKEVMGKAPQLTEALFAGDKYGEAVGRYMGHAAVMAARIGVPGVLWTELAGEVADAALQVSPEAQAMPLGDRVLNVGKTAAMLLLFKHGPKLFQSKMAVDMLGKGVATGLAKSTQIAIPSYLGSTSGAQAFNEMMDRTGDTERATLAYFAAAMGDATGMYVGAAAPAGSAEHAKRVSRYGELKRAGLHDELAQVMSGLKRMPKIETAKPGTAGAIAQRFRGEVQAYQRGELPPEAILQPSRKKRMVPGAPEPEPFIEPRLGEVREAKGVLMPEIREKFREARRGLGRAREAGRGAEAVERLGRVRGRQEAARQAITQAVREGVSAETVQGLKAAYMREYGVPFLTAQPEARPEPVTRPVGPIPPERAVGAIRPGAPPVGEIAPGRPPIGEMPPGARERPPRIPARFKTEIGDRIPQLRVPRPLRAELGETPVERFKVEPAERPVVKGVPLPGEVTGRMKGVPPKVSPKPEYFYSGVPLPSGAEVEKVLRGVGKAIKAEAAPKPKLRPEPIPGPPKKPLPEPAWWESPLQAAAKKIQKTTPGRYYEATLRVIHNLGRGAMAKLVGKPEEVKLKEIGPIGEEAARRARTIGPEVRSLAQRIAGKIGNVSAIFPEGKVSRAGMEALMGDRGLEGFNPRQRQALKSFHNFINKEVTPKLVEYGIIDRGQAARRAGKYLRVYTKEVNAAENAGVIRRLWNQLPGSAASRAIRVTKEMRKGRKYETLAALEKAKLTPITDLQYTLGRQWIEKGAEVIKGRHLDWVAKQPLLARQGKAVRRGRAVHFDRPEGVAGDWELVTGKQWGNLSGHYVHPDVVTLVKGEPFLAPTTTGAQSNIGKIAEFMAPAARGLERWGRSIYTVYNAPRHFVQGLENMWALDVNAGIDIMNPRHWRFFADSVREMAGKTPLFKEFMSKTNLGSADYWSVFLKKSGAAKARNGAELVKALAKGYEAQPNALVRLYRMEDVYGRYVAYRKARLAGNTVTDSEQFSNWTIPNNAIAPPLIKNIERKWFGPMFLTAEWNATANVIRSATTIPGQMRLLKWAGYLGAIEQVAMKRLGLSQDDVQDIRKSMYRHGLAIPLPFADDAGRPYMLDMRRVTPRALDVLATAIRGHGGTADAALEQGNDLVFQSVLFRMALETLSGRTRGFGQREIYPPEAMLKTKAELAVKSQIKNLVPSFAYWTIQDIMKMRKPARGRRLPGVKETVLRRAVGVPYVVGRTPGGARRQLRIRKERERRAEKRAQRLRGVPPQKW